MGGGAIEAARWHRWAAEARSEAGRMRNLDAVQTMLEVAEICERLAAAAAKQADTECGQSP